MLDPARATPDPPGPVFSHNLKTRAESNGDAFLDKVELIGEQRKAQMAMACSVTVKMSRKARWQRRRVPWWNPRPRAPRSPSA
jgi:hypothetical protein